MCKLFSVYATVLNNDVNISSNGDNKLLKLNAWIELNKNITEVYKRTAFMVKPWRYPGLKDKTKETDREII